MFSAGRRSRRRHLSNCRSAASRRKAGCGISSNWKPRHDRASRRDFAVVQVRRQRLGLADGQGHSGWEEMPYWLKGYGDLGYVLKDEKIIREARRWIDAVLASQDSRRLVRPAPIKQLDKNRAQGQTRSVAAHGHAQRAAIVLRIHRRPARAAVHDRNTSSGSTRQPPETFGHGYWPKIRFGDNIESVYWLYNRTGEALLLELDQENSRPHADWTTGVQLAQREHRPRLSRAGRFIRSKCPTKNSSKAAERNYRQVMDVYGQFPGGGFAGDENCRPGFTDPRQGFETCGIVEFMHSFEMLTKISGNPALVRPHARRSPSTRCPRRSRPTGKGCTI